jgi:hypothetical protein
MLGKLTSALPKPGRIGPSGRVFERESSLSVDEESYVLAAIRSESERCRSQSTNRLLGISPMALPPGPKAPSLPQSHGKHLLIA